MNCSSCRKAYVSINLDVDEKGEHRECHTPAALCVFVSIIKKNKKQRYDIVTNCDGSCSRNKQFFVRWLQQGGVFYGL